MKKPKILIVNDDGIKSKGIRHLIKIMNDFGDVVVVAPNKPQSAMGHAISLEKVLRCDRINIDNGSQLEFSCNGTPADCVKLALNKILHFKPDLIVSGINHGSNSSINVIYSGTVAAAIEGALNGIPAIAFSLLDYSADADFTETDKYIREIVAKLFSNKFKNNICLNVNFPKPIKGRKIKGIKICRQADANWNEEFDERIDPKGRKYYWLAGNFVNNDEELDTDEWALNNHYVSIVPISFDLTDYNLKDYLTSKLNE